MRLSLRKVVKYTTFLALFIILNIWISYSVNFWSFKNFDDRGKVSQTWGRNEDNGGSAHPPDNRGQYDSEDAVETRRKLDSELPPRHRRENQVDAHNESVLFVQYENSVSPRQKTLVARQTFDKGNNSSSSDRTSRREPATFAKREIHERKLQAKKQSGETELKDIFISVKTTSKYHRARVKLLLDTWYLLAREQVN